MTVTQKTKAPAPPLGSPFARLWTASIASNLADGIGRLAVPLLAVSLTSDPIAIAVIGALAYVPWLLFGIPAGVLADRIDRRVAMALGNGVRFLVAAGLTLAIATDHLSLWLLYATTIVFGVGETIVDNATNAVVPALVDKPNLDRANSRIQAAQISVDNFIATPISGVLYAAAIVLPTIVGATGYVVAAGLALALPVVAARARPPASDEATAVVLPEASAIPGEQPQEVESLPATRVTAREGLRYLWRHRYLRAMTMVTAFVGLGFSLGQATTILLFLNHFGVPAAAIGVLTTGVGLGALAGSLVAPALVRRWGRGNVMFAATAVGGLALAGVGAAPNVWVALASYALGACGVAAWNVPWGSVRQAIIPGHLLGRVLGLIRTLVWGVMPVAIILGGWLGRVRSEAPLRRRGSGVVRRLARCRTASPPGRRSRSGGVEESPEGADVPRALRPPRVPRCREAGRRSGVTGATIGSGGGAMAAKDVLGARGRGHRRPGDREPRLVGPRQELAAHPRARLGAGRDRHRRRRRAPARRRRGQDQEHVGVRRGDRGRHAGQARAPPEARRRVARGPGAALRRRAHRRRVHRPRFRGAARVELLSGVE